MVEGYGKKARQINAQYPAHRRAYTWVNAQCKERKERSGGKERKKYFFSPREGFEPTTLTLEGKAPVCLKLKSGIGHLEPALGNGIS